MAASFPTYIYNKQITFRNEARKKKRSIYIKRARVYLSRRYSMNLNKKICLPFYNFFDLYYLVNYLHAFGI
jgi:putative flippase GtrA